VEMVGRLVKNRKQYKRRNNTQINNENTKQETNKKKIAT
jgi:hypothetical protein